MGRGTVAASVALIALFASAGTPAPAWARAPYAATTTTAPGTPPPPPPPPPHAYVLVDADTGAVVAASNARVPMRVASVFKIITAIVVRENLPPDADVTVSPRAEGMPARKINLKTGQVWKSGDLMHALLIVSANDAAVALAEQTAGSLEAFGGMLDRTAARLGLADSPVLRDPAGLDDEFSVDGGNLISARDVAIAARVFLSYPELRDIVGAPLYRFNGGDGNPHRLLNHDPLLKTYAGAIGIKTGYTRRAGHSLAAAAQRGGRTMIAVVIGAADAPRSAAGLLDQGFATPATAEPLTDLLPPPSRGDARDATTKSLPAPRPVSTPAAHRSRSSGGTSWPAALLVLIAGGLPAVVILLRRRSRTGQTSGDTFRRYPPESVTRGSVRRQV